ncbi:MAG: GNAT family N-acetyltransferase [Thermodesulfobacteriota bacterium]
MNIAELKERVLAGEIPDIGNSDEIASGELRSSSGTAVDNSITLGWNLIHSKECDDSWSQYNLKLLEHIDNQNYGEEELSKVLDSIQTEDFHWDWFAKSWAMRTAEYRWFYLYADNRPQGACVIYQPKDSALQTSNIFYVEFVAVAPWNRDCLIREREFLGVGTILLKAALEYSVNELGLTPGFSLHSLPQAQKYYEKFRMVNIERMQR